jgi:hypothetical protein
VSALGVLDLQKRRPSAWKVQTVVRRHRRDALGTRSRISAARLGT